MYSLGGSAYGRVPMLEVIIPYMSEAAFSYQLPNTDSELAILWSPR